MPILGDGYPESPQGLVDVAMFDAKDFPTTHCRLQSQCDDWLEVGDG